MKVMQSDGAAHLLIVEPNVAEHRIFRLTDYREAFDKADLVVSLVAHKPFKTLPADPDKIILDFCGLTGR